jgi:hypothetical protein
MRQKVVNNIFGILSKVKNILCISKKIVTSMIAERIADI